MADFFSLISLTVIYIIIAFSPQSPLTRDSIDVVSAVASATGPASEIDTRIAYVSILPSDPQLVLRVATGTGSIKDRVVRSGSDARAAAEWLRNILSAEPSLERVVFYLGAEDESGHAHRLFHKLLKDTKQRFDVSLVLLDADEGHL
jgi:hypothetical protein